MHMPHTLTHESATTTQIRTHTGKGKYITHLHHPTSERRMESSATTFWRALFGQAVKTGGIWWKRGVKGVVWGGQQRRGSYPAYVFKPQQRHSRAYHWRFVTTSPHLSPHEPQAIIAFKGFALCPRKPHSPNLSHMRLCVRKHAKYGYWRAALWERSWVSEAWEISYN